jgi:putative membrane protein
MTPSPFAMRCSPAGATVASEADFVPDRRLHPLSWLFVLIGSIRQFIIPLLAVIFFDARDDGSAWGALFVVPLVAAAVWRQYLFRYGFGPRGLVIREGLLFRNVRQIEYARIENIDTERGPLHRFLNVAEVRLETSAGGKPEALIRVLGVDAVQELRERIFGRTDTTSSQAPASSAAPAEEVLLHLSSAELLRYGFVDNRGMLVLAAAFGVVSQSGVMRGAGRYLEERLFTTSSDTFGLSLAIVGIGFFITVVLFVRLLSLVWALATLHDFTLVRQAGDLRIRYGWLTRVGLTLRLPRIQAAHQTQSVLHRFFGRVSVAVDLAGNAGQQGDENGAPSTRVRWLAPICTPRRAAEIMRIALPVLQIDSPPQWQPLAPGASGRIFRKVVTVATLLGAVPAIYWLNYGAALLLLLILPLAWLHARQYVRHTRWALTREALFWRRGWLTRRLSIVPRNRIQVVHEVVSPFDARKRMATLVVDTAGASALANGVRIAYLPRDTARSLAHELYVSANQSTAQGRAAAAG